MCVRETEKGRQTDRHREREKVSERVCCSVTGISNQRDSIKSFLPQRVQMASTVTFSV